MTDNQTRGRTLALNLMCAQELAGGTFRGLLDVAIMADELGVDSVVLPDHLAMHKQAHSDRDGFPYSLETAWFEPITALSAIAAVTQNVRLGMNVLVAPLRSALVLGKQLATLDVVAEGRLDAAFGVGWQAEEFAAADVQFAGRFGRLVEMVEACRSLWEGGPSEYHGKYVNFDDMYSLPSPTQHGGPPISLGLPLSPRNVERILRLRAGWSAPPLPVDDLRNGINLLREASAAAGGDPSMVRVTAAAPLPAHGKSSHELGLAHPVADAVSYWEAGADAVVVHPMPFCRTADDLPAFIKPLLEAREQ